MLNATTEQTEAKAPARADGHGPDSQPTGRGPRAGVFAPACSPTQNGPTTGPFTAKIGVGGFEPHTPFCQGSPPTLGQNGDVASSPYSSRGTGDGVLEPGSPPAGARSGAGDLSESNRAAAGISQSSPVVAFSHTPATGRTTTFVGPAADRADIEDTCRVCNPGELTGSAYDGGESAARTTLTRAEKDDLLRKILMLLTAVALGFVFVAAARQAIKPIEFASEPPVGRP